MTPCDEQVLSDRSSVEPALSKSIAANPGRKQNIESVAMECEEETARQYQTQGPGSTRTKLILAVQSHINL